MFDWAEGNNDDSWFELSGGLKSWGFEIRQFSQRVLVMLLISVISVSYRSQFKILISTTFRRRLIDSIFNVLQIFATQFGWGFLSVVFWCNGIRKLYLVFTTNYLKMRLARYPVMTFFIVYIKKSVIIGPLTSFYSSGFP